MLSLRRFASRFRPSSALGTLFPGLLCVAAAWPTTGWAYQKATEGSEVVMDKLFPKKGKVELDGTFGLVLNSSYTQTFLANAGLDYFWSEEWGFNITGNFAISKDKDERKCIETFYNDPNFDIDPECGSDSPKDLTPADPDADWGPAYVPIRELKYMITGNVLWNPIYGKQIVLLSATNYFDFFLGAGGGLAFSTYYPKQATFADGHPSRGTFCVKAQQAADAKEHCDLSQLQGGQNPGTLDDSKIGPSGRPLPRSESTPLIHLMLGQRFHFMKRFLVTATLENYTLVGTESGFDDFLTLTGGFGVRF